jgi:cyclohexanone monooxygenase
MAAKVAPAAQLPHVGVAEPPNPVANFPSQLPVIPDKGSFVDIATLKKRYLEERDKRLNARPEGNAQYKEFKGIFEKYLKDPYTPRVEREPLDIEIDFLVLGGGYGGQCVAAELIKAGITNIRLIEKAGDFGGTWYWNRYPGAACDVGM